MQSIWDANPPGYPPKNECEKIVELREKIKGLERNLREWQGHCEWIYKMYREARRQLQKVEQGVVTNA
jgi:hypothetical protein